MPQKSSVRLLVVGYGSIGARHARVAAGLGAAIACVTRNTACPFERFDGLATAISAFRPSHVLIANATADHLPSLDALFATGWNGPVLVEKPLFHVAVPASRYAGRDIVVAYNLRFHPLVRALGERVAGWNLTTASFRVGQYLPDWRPGTDYRTSYSASRAGGGGVLRDLSHELDLAYRFCGPLRHLAALGGHLSPLEIDSDDVFHIIGAAERCRAVNIEMNYLDRTASRILTLNGAEGTARLDFIAGRLDVAGETIEAKPERDATYTAQLVAFFAGERHEFCQLVDALHIDATALAAEQASTTRTWCTVGTP